MPLKEIKIYLNKRNPSLFLQLLEEKTEKLDKEIQQLLVLKRMMAYMKENTLFAVTHDHEDICVRDYPKEILLCSDNLENTTSKNFASFMEEYIRFCTQHNVLVLESVGCMLTIENIQKKEYQNFSHLFMKIEKDIQKKIKIRPAGSYLCAWHKGPYDTIHETYEKMLSYAKKHQLTLGNYAYEEYLIADFAQKDHHQYVTYIRMDLA